eukprot:s2350_g2.t1
MAMQVVVSMETVGDDAAEPFFKGLFGELRRDWEGEIGVRFLAQSTFVITSLGRHLGDRDALEEDCSVTLWFSGSKLASVKVGPSSPVIQGYAYTEVFPRIVVHLGDMSDAWPDACSLPAADMVEQRMLNFRAVPGIATLPVCPEMTVYELKQQLEAVTGVENGDLLVLAVQDSWQQRFRVGSVLATGSKDGTARLWAVETGKCLRDGTARIWSVETGSCLAELAGHADEVYSAAFAPSGGQVLTASQDHTARVWSVDGTCTHVLDKHLGAVSAARFSPDGSRIVTASTDGTARVWEPVFGKCLLTLQGHGGSVSIAEISPDSTMLLTSALDTQGVLLRDANSGQVLRSLCDGLQKTEMVEFRHEAQLRRANFCADGSLVVTICANHNVFVWQAVHVATGNLVQELGHADAVACAAFSPDSVQLDAVARVWDVTSGSCNVVLAGHEARVTSAAFSP